MTKTCTNLHCVGTKTTMCILLYYITQGDSYTNHY